MKKIILSSLFLLFFFISNAQNLSYGVLLGITTYDSNNNNNQSNFSSNPKQTILNLGGYVDFRFSNNIGLKTDVTFNQKELSLLNSSVNFKLNFIEISPNLKYDFGDEYRKGFYMLIGPRVSFLTSAKTEGVDATSLFNTTNIGLQLGLGYRIFKSIDLEGKFDYGVTPYIENKNDNSKFFGTYISLNLDLERIINK